MACDCALYCRPEGTRVQFGYPTLPDPGSVVCDAPPVYRPHHPEFSVFYQVFENHFDNYVRAYEERFEPNSGPLRRVVLESVEEFLSCGRLQGGFARIRCPDCRSEHLLAFSCRTRNFCGSCQAKRAALFAEKLTGEILAPVPHRHWTFTVPKALRGLFERERSLLGLLSRTAYDAILKTYQALFRRTDVRPGCVTSIQTFGAFASNFNPHVHAIVTDGVFTPQREFLSLCSLDTAAICEVFRRLLLRRLHAEERLSQRFMDNLLSWVHPGFSVFAGPPIPPEDRQQLEQLARYIARPPVALEAIRMQDEGRLSVTTPPDPHTGATTLILDPLDWIHAVTAHIPDRGQHGTRYYGIYANRSRLSAPLSKNEAAELPAIPRPGDEDSDFAKSRRASWARLLRKIFEVDPMLCPCGGKMKIVSVITDPRVVDRILRHLESPACRGRDPFQPRPPPQTGRNL
jgi:hypothetical protein